MKRSWLVFIAAGALLSAQSGPPERVIAQVPGESDNAPATAIKTLRAPSRRKAPAPRIEGTINSQLMVQREAPLAPNVRAALAISESWLDTSSAPVGGSDGRVLYLYGKGAPTIVCAQFHVCEIDLQPGEIINEKSLDIGDDRWAIERRLGGAGSEAFTYLIVKPKYSSLDTSLVVGTDRHQYWLRLISTDVNGAYTPRTAFKYPTEELEQRKAAEAALAQAALAEQLSVAKRLEVLNTEKPISNWRYGVKLHGRDAKYLRPVSVGDDGTHTYIQLSGIARNRGLPIVQVKDARGPIPTNSHWSAERANLLVVDALFEHACLLEGVGRKQQRACITNKSLGREEN